MSGLGYRQGLPDTLLLDDAVIDQMIETFQNARPLVRYFD